MKNRNQETNVIVGINGVMQKLLLYIFLIYRIPSLVRAPQVCSASPCLGLLPISNLV